MEPKGKDGNFGRVRIFYVREKKRVICIAYQPSNTEKDVYRYGASIFHPKIDDKIKTWMKVPHRTTALHRLEMFPVTVNLNAAMSQNKFTGKAHYEFLERELRKCLITCKVQAPRKLLS